MDLNTLEALISKNKILAQQIVNINQILGQLHVGPTSAHRLICDFRGGDHINGGCEIDYLFEQINYVVNFQKLQNNPYYNTYKPGWGNYLNLLWDNQSLYRYPAPPYQPPMYQTALKNYQV